MSGDLKIGTLVGVNMDDDNFCRGYGAADTAPMLESDEGFPSDGICEGSLDEAPAMPAEYYENVEGFLKMAPPKLKKDGTGVGQRSHKVLKEGKGNKPPHLPNIKGKAAGSESQMRSSPPNPPTLVTAGKLGPRSTAASAIMEGKHSLQQPNKSTLLKEAFAYTENLLKQAIIEEAEAEREKDKQKSGQAGGKSGSQSAPTSQQKQLIASAYNSNPKKQLTRSASSGTAASGTSKRSEGMVKKLRSKTATGTQGVGATGKGKINASGSVRRSTVESDGFDLSTDPEQSMNKAALDFDELVNNFKTGTTLEKLRKELQHSQKSMKKSEDFLRQLSAEFITQR